MACNTVSVTAPGFEDRFDAGRYRDDPTVGVFCEPAGIETWVPERVYRRLLLLGKAYELHYLDFIPGDSEPRYLNSTQAAGLVDELEFLAGVVEDSLLKSAVAEILKVVGVAVRCGEDQALRVEGH